MSSGQNNKLEEVRKFLSAILSGELSGYKIKQQNDELFQLTKWTQNQKLISGAEFSTVSDQVIMIDYSTVQITDKGKQVLAETGGPVNSQATKSQAPNPKVVPLNQNSLDPKVAAMVEAMNPEDQKTAQVLLTALKSGQSNQLIYKNYLEFFNRNPQFYNYFINTDKSNIAKKPVEAETSTANSAPKASSNGIFSPEVQKIIANMHQNQGQSQPKTTPRPASSDLFQRTTSPQAEPKTAPASKVEPQVAATPKPNLNAQSEPQKATSTKVTPTPKPQVTPEPSQETVAPASQPTTASTGKLSSHVTIRYVNQDNDEIAPTLNIQLTSQTAAYDVTKYQKQIHDYNFVQADKAQGQLTGQDFTVTFHYEAKIARGSIRVNYVNQQGEDIAEEKVVQGGHIREFYPLLEDLPAQLVTLIKSRRYQLRSILADNDPTDSSLIYFSDLDQNFTAIFQELAPGRITLRYRNLKKQEIGIGKRIMENNVHNGEQVAIPLPLVPTGYELDQTLLNGDPVRVGDQFTVTPESQIIDYVFKRVIADGAIIFNYVDQDGRQIANPTTIRGGRYGEVYGFRENLPQAILNRINDGVYENNPIIKEEGENGTVIPANRIIFDNQDHEYSAVFQATEAAKITLKFVTTDDNPIPNVENKVVQGTHYYGDTFVIPSAPVITGFDLNRVMVNDKAAKIDDPIMYSNQEKTITYVYTIATSTITAHHVDQLGRQIAEDRVITGQIGTTVEQSKLVSLRLNPYFILSDVLTNNSNYTFSNDPQFITFHYQVDDNLVPDVNNVADVVLLNCLDTNGNIIGRVTPSAMHLDQVKVGHVYSLHAPDFAGYHLFSNNDAVRIVWNSEKANDFVIVNHPNGLAFIYQSV